MKSVLKYLGYAALAVVALFAALLAYSATQPSIDRIQTLTFQGKTLHVVTIGSKGAFKIKTDGNGSEIETLGRRYVIATKGRDFLLDGQVLDTSTGKEFSIVLHPDGRRELKPGRY